MAPTLFQSAFSSFLLLSSFTLSNAHSHFHRRDVIAHSHLHRRGVVIPTQLPGGWTSKGCYTEGSSSRALTGASYNTNTAMTDESCITFCSGKGFIYAGTEYSAECYCGNAFTTGSVPAAAGDCSMACSGNATEACGGPNRLNVFTSGKAPPPAPVNNPGPAHWTLLGCYTDQAQRTLTNGMGTTGGGGALTVALCTSACQAANYIYAGVEYAGECYCGNAFSNGGGPAPDGFSGCNMLCNGNSSEYCGGPNRLDMYSFNGAGTGTTSATATSTTQTTVTGTGSASGLPTGWTYKGCYVDGANGRILSTQNPDSSTLTIESCVQTCAGLGYSVAGMEYSVQCFCGNSIVNGGTLAAADTDCNAPCGGNSKENCGAGNRMSIYSKGALTIYGPPAAQKSGLPGSWQYQGCISDNQPGRTFPYQLILTNNNTAENCLSQCSQFGFGAGGMEYGEECYCGDVANIAANGATVKPEADCNVACPGNSTYICGGGNRLSYYAWTGTPLQTWTFATGNAAGQYQFLIGGVCIPLLTTPGVNGKVSFLEKYGTGEPNSTGAYELDISQLNNFAAAWRPMHVKTDVFCSAGLTLPDKVGRQINVGGWSGESTYGIRLYWPDGSPGVPGVNDWQENYNEVALQVGRWYPTAMIMANGSILVVGGENGSNGPPVPSLEIVPKPAGGTTVFCDWLKRTDPNNLYPFLTVLPGGGIFVAYYNEARILDAKTFATTKTLPNIPGSVNNFLSGRTYPFEGAAVLFPQYAPYTDPLTVLICGGSNAGAAIAVDNCVFTQPEAANPVWTLERMPSQRVMPCMTALPDGTYLILNGAHHGVAGFGLATDPNLNAILYDPSKPVNTRMTVMANTTVARLYHSEAVLLQDGRVLVSGSDPQDGVHPEEYRVEVFVPPYLLSGLARPTFTMTNKDWAYGQSVQIVVTSGNTANMKVSLLGAETSTHGNSMGQRTIFPAVSCAGNTCTITAPPNANVCPPGWFQVFILDGPTPSTATYVRIGGDPAALGNWPAFPDFKVPGV